MTESHQSCEMDAAHHSAGPSPSTGKPGTNTNREFKPPKARPVSVTFLGTCAGSGPIVSRNCSSLVLNLDGSLWLFDCAEGTRLQFHHHPRMKMAKVRRIFITHMHADHTLGLVPLLSTSMTGCTTTPEDLDTWKALGKEKVPTMHIYGPPGLRKLMRQTLTITSYHLGAIYAVHELIPADQEPSCGCEDADLHANEAVGMDIKVEEDGTWRDIVAQAEGRKGSKNGRKGDHSGEWESGWKVDVGPVDHRVLTFGYVLSEPMSYEPLDTATLIPLIQSQRSALASLSPPIKNPLSLLSVLSSTHAQYTLPNGIVLEPPKLSSYPPRKIAIFGDCAGTHNQALKTLSQGASLLVHECTNAWIDPAIEKGERGKVLEEEEVDHSVLAEVKHRMKEKTNLLSATPGGKYVEDGFNPVPTISERSDAEVDGRDRIEKRARSRGHSVPDMVGKFARELNVKRLAMNHFSAMFPSPRFVSEDPFPGLFSHSTMHSSHRSPSVLSNGEIYRRIVMSNIESQATSCWVKANHHHLITDADVRAIASRDLMTIEVPSDRLTEEEVERNRFANFEAITAEKAWIKGGSDVTRQLHLKPILLEKYLSDHSGGESTDNALGHMISGRIKGAGSANSSNEMGKDVHASNADLANAFYAEFVLQKSIIEKHLTATPPSIDNAANTFKLLKLALADAIAYLSAYDRKRYDGQINDIQKHLIAAKAKTAKPPSSKFSFSKPAASKRASTPKELSPEQTSTTGVSEVVLQDDSTSYSIKDETEARITLHDIKATQASFSLSLTNIKDSFIDLSSSVNDKQVTALYIAGISNSLIIAPQVTGSVFVINVQNSVLLVGCRQYRMHKSKDTTIFLKCSSHPIIEHSSDLSFSSMPTSYGMEGNKNLWDQVQDFDWIRDGGSPNWRKVSAMTPSREEALLRFRSAQTSEAGSCQLQQILNALKE